MSTELENQVSPEAGTESLSLLDRAIAATNQTPADQTKELFSVLAEQALSGTVTWDKNLTKTIENAIAEIDKQMSRQLSAIMQQDEFRRLEGSWRGLNKLVTESETGQSLKIKLVDFTKDELIEQFEDAPAVDRSPLFDALYQKEFGTAGGEPYGALIGDYTFSHKDEDVALMRYMGETAAASHAPLSRRRTRKCLSLTRLKPSMRGNPLRLVLTRQPTHHGMLSVKAMIHATWC